MKIVFDEEEQEQGGNWVWHYGTLTESDKDHPFTVLVMGMIVGGMEVAPSVEITWSEDEPVNKTEAEKLIMGNS